MTVVGFVVHGGRPAAVRVAGGLVGWLAERGFEVRLLAEEPGSVGPPGAAGARRPDGTPGATNPPATGTTAPPGGIAELVAAGAARLEPSEPFADGLELVVSVGGDGTFLRASHQAAQAGCPVVGVNVGRLGFLTAVDPEDARAVIEAAVDGRATIEERLAVVAEPVGGTDWTGPRWGLNEVMVEKAARHRVLRVAVFIAGEYVTTFSGDGVLVATPTGSTAYSFSARGPIVSPVVDCLVVTPIAAHMVFDRSFVIGADEEVTIEVRGEEEGVLSTDGLESLPLPIGARVLVRRADRSLRLVRPPGAESFYRRVRERFSLPDGSAMDADRDGGDVVPPS